jgi:competence protein ComEA
MSNFKNLVLVLAAGLCLAANTCTALEINQATAAELDSIRGIGPGLSTPILAERSKAPFKDWADLVARIKGIGPATAARFSAQGLTVDGASYEPPPRAPQRSAR